MGFNDIMLGKVTSFSIKVLRFVLYKLMQLDASLNKKFNVTSHNKAVVKSTQKHNMVQAVDEQYYAAQYWQRILKFVAEQNIDSAGKFLDIGCGQGRISIPLAKWCQAAGQVTAIDLSEAAIAQAKSYANKEQVRNVNFIVSDLFSYLQSLPANSIDGIVFLEVAFFLPDYQRALAEMIRVLKPQGFFIGSFRSQYYNILYSLQHGLWHSVETVLKERTGAIMGGETQFNWHTTQELQSLLAAYQVQITHMSGIGTCSGIAGDPHAVTIRPSKLSTKEQAILKQAEDATGYFIPDAGRYILLAGRLQ